MPDPSHRALERAAKTRELRDQEHDVLWDEHEGRESRSAVWKDVRQRLWRLVGSASVLVGLGLALREAWRALFPA